VWHFQAAHHGLWFWDYDFPAPPILGNITVDGRRIKAVIQVSKQAFTYVFDRKTGEPVWPIEERSVPHSKVPGERTSPTQPFPTKPPPFDLQGAIEENLVDFTSELRRWALEQLQALEHGPLYTPISSTRPTVLVPGIAGGAGFDPESGILYVPSRLNPWVLQLIPGDPKQGHMRFLKGPALGGLATIDGLSIFKPRYSRVTAIDLNRGGHRWMAPLGNGSRSHPLLKDLGLPPLSQRYQRAGDQDAALRHHKASEHEMARTERSSKATVVFDKTSGTLVRVIEMDGLAAAAPMTYLHRGKQYIVVATNGTSMNELVALSLPETPGN
jgi:quinoprotein glucose dehydrogenase